MVSPNTSTDIMQTTLMNDTHTVIKPTASSQLNAASSSTDVVLSGNLSNSNSDEVARPTAGLQGSAVATTPNTNESVIVDVGSIKHVVDTEKDAESTDNAPPTSQTDNATSDATTMADAGASESFRALTGKQDGCVSYSARKRMLDSDKDDPLSVFLATIGDEVQYTQSGKIRFKVSGMEFSKTTFVDILKRYYAGSAYRRAKVAAANAEYDFKQHEPHIVPHRENKKFLWCALMRKVLPLDATVVQRHVASKRYKLRLEAAEKKEAEQQRIREKRRKRLVGEREAKRAAKQSSNDEALINIPGYDSADDSEFEAKAAGRAESDDDIPEEDIDDPLMEQIHNGKPMDVVDDIAAQQLNRVRPERKSKARASAIVNNPKAEIPGYESAEDSDFDPAEEDDDMEMEPYEGPDPLAGEHIPTPTPRRSKERAVAIVAEEAAQLDSDESSDDADFRPGGENSDNEDVSGGIGNVIDPINSAIFAGGSLAAALMDSDEESGSSEGEKDDEIEEVEQQMQGKPAHAPIQPNVSLPLFLEPTLGTPSSGQMSSSGIDVVRASLQKKKQVKKKALKRAMKKAASDRRAVTKAKEEMRMEAMAEADGAQEENFWTRGKFNVRLDDLPSAGMNDGNDTDDEWATPTRVVGSKRKRPGSTPKKSRQERLRRVTGGDDEGPSFSTN